MASIQLIFDPNCAIYGMTLLSYNKWLHQNESSPASRSFAAAKAGLLPPTELVRHGLGGHRTEPGAAEALAKVKIADDPNRLDHKKHKKKHKKHKKHKPQ